MNMYFSSRKQIFLSLKYRTSEGLKREILAFNLSNEQKIL